jgi:hypothetical protein
MTREMALNELNSLLQRLGEANNGADHARATFRCERCPLQTRTHRFPGILSLLKTEQRRSLIPATEPCLRSKLQRVTTRFGTNPDQDSNRGSAEAAFCALTTGCGTFIRDKTACEARLTAPVGTGDISRGGDASWFDKLAGCTGRVSICRRGKV